jgi:hypothetical protein
MTRSLPLLTLLASGCLITDADHAARLDQDGDGYTLGEDCDDSDDSVGAGAVWYTDADGDGFAAEGAESVEACFQPSGYAAELGDCDDGDPSVLPGADDDWYDGVDSDCDGADDYDQDGDGWQAEDWGEDCDDEDPSVNPGAREEMDGLDNDCDGDTDFVDLAWAGLVLEGEESEDQAGQSVAGLGDVNGDGFDDLLVGTDHPASGDVLGKAYLLLGPATGALQLGADTLTITGALVREKTGHEVAAAGDTDGDGLADFMVGAYQAENEAGEAPGRAYLFLGASDISSMGVDEAALTIEGVNADDDLGYEMAGGGDLDGDGLADIAVTAVSYANARGKVYLALGGSEHRGLVGVDDLDAGFTGLASSDRHGRGVAMGDVNGDGLDELITGAKEHDANGTNAGAVFLLDFSGSVASRDMNDVDATLLGESAGDHAGGAIAVQDLDGDGYAELLVGAETATANGTNAGAVYLVPGASTLPSGSLGEATTRMDGEPGCRLGRAVAFVGDADGDGETDLVFGGPECELNGEDSGAVVVISGFEGALFMEDASLVLAGSGSSHKAGWTVGPAGDIDDDGLPDLLVGAPDEGGGAGHAYVWLGADR